MIKIKKMKVKKKKRSIGKISEDVIFRELTKENPKHLKEIGVLAGSTATNEQAQCNVVPQKLVSSSELQARLAAHRKEQLIMHSELARRLNKRILEKKDVEKIGSGEALKTLISNGSLLQNLTKQEKPPENPNSSANPVNLAIEKLAKVAESALNKINNPFTKEAIEIKPKKGEKVDK